MSGCYCTAPATTGHLCTEHLGKLRRELLAAPGVLADLDLTVTGQAKQGGGGSDSGTRMAFNEAASDRAEDLKHILRSAAHDADPQTRHVYGEPPANLAARAVGGLQAVARNPGAHTTAQDLTEALAAAVRVMDRAEEKISYGPCECGVELVAPKSRDQATCRGCGAVWDVTQLRAFRHVAAIDALEDRAGTLKEITGWLSLTGFTVSPRTVEKWPRKAFDPLQPTEGGLYRYADARKLAERHAERGGRTA